MIAAAGILFRTPDGKVLLLRRSEEGDAPGQWALPGGRVEGNETPEQAAVRECYEELGDVLPKTGRPNFLTRQQRRNIDYTALLWEVPEEFTPVLNDEHEEAVWADPAKPPRPLHPGMDIVLKRQTLDELGLAKAIAAGELTSPQQYHNIWLFDLRITGTGAAFRKGLNEYVWRDPSMYLNDEFLARCSGLPVVVEHPDKKTLDTREFQDRVVGSILLPHLVGNEVWGVAKIYDTSAAEMMNRHQLSTSPGVVLTEEGSENTRKMPDGSTLLIEGKPCLLDHLALCEVGVWDKGGEPAGVKTTLNNGGSTVAEDKPNTTEEDQLKEDQARKDAEAGEKLDKMLACLDSLTKRMDALEDEDPGDVDPGAGMGNQAISDKAKKDAEDAEAAEEAEAEKQAAEKAAKDEKEVVDAAARKDAADTKRRLDELEKSVPKELNDADYAAMADAQAGADKVYHALGDAAPRPLRGEGLLAYRRRLATGLKEHSDNWKGVDLASLPKAALDIAERQIRADAMSAALNPQAVAEGQLREIVNVDSTGRRITSFVGQPSSWMSQFTSTRRRLAGVRNGSR